MSMYKIWDCIQTSFIFSPQRAFVPLPQIRSMSLRLLRCCLPFGSSGTCAALMSVLGSFRARNRSFLPECAVLFHFCLNSCFGWNSGESILNQLVNPTLWSLYWAWPCLAVPGLPPFPFSFRTREGLCYSFYSMYMPPQADVCKKQRERERESLKVRECQKGIERLWLLAFARCISSHFHDVWVEGAGSVLPSWRVLLGQPCGNQQSQGWRSYREL